MHKTTLLITLLLMLLLSGATYAAASGNSEKESEQATEKDSDTGLSYSINRTAMSVHFGLLTTQAFSELYAGPHQFVNADMVALSLSRELFSVGDLFNVRQLRPLKFEIEGTTALHWGTWHSDHVFVEFAASFNIRWHQFPWNKYVLTTAGFGEGVSFATEKPSYETEINNMTSQWLNFLMFDMTFALPDYPNWALQLRLHHRSGIFGLINNISGGANFFTAGLKYTFD